MAGSTPGWNGAEFRDAIRFAMKMGLPGDVNERVTFRWVTRSSYNVADPAGAPYDWTAAPSSETVITDLAVDCAWEFVARPAGAEETTMAAIDPSRIIVTLLDEEFDAIMAHGGRRPDEIIAGRNTYDITFEVPPMGLFDVTVRQFHATARDEA